MPRTGGETLANGDDRLAQKYAQEGSDAMAVAADI